VALSALAAALADAATNRQRATVLRSTPTAWRNLLSQPQRRSFDGPDGRIDVGYQNIHGVLVAEGHEDLRLVTVRPDEVEFEHDGCARRFSVAAYDTSGVVHVDSAAGAVVLRPVPRFGTTESPAVPGSLAAPLPGVITRIAATPGQEVDMGEPLVWLEAMKMEHTVASPTNGVVREVPVEIGQQVDAGTVLVIVEAKEEEDPERRELGGSFPINSPASADN
jgi:propionyl-CoA carboxylase alpha chain